MNRGMLVAVVAFWVAGNLSSSGCDQVQVTRKGGKVVFCHNSALFDEDGARKYLKAMTATNGWATGFVAVDGENPMDAERCARLLRAAGVRKVEIFPPLKKKEIP